ncbi:MAG: exodeoxyribonuclease VII small subunit [Nitrospirota bacterium]
MEKEIKFEGALGELEGIVRKLEQGGLPLEESLSAFERGMKLSKVCFKKLNEAQRKIEILTKDEQTGEIITKPFSLEEENAGEEEL